MWRHYCPEEKAWISVGKGQPCNWCEQIEKEKHDRNNQLDYPAT
jgi:hypothetical protein